MLAQVGGAEPSPNHNLYAWSEDTVGGEKYTLRVKSLADGKEVMDAIPETSGDVEWANDNATLFYVVKDHLDRCARVGVGVLMHVRVRVGVHVRVRVGVGVPVFSHCSRLHARLGWCTSVPCASVLCILPA